MPVKAAPPVVAAPPSWTGFYLGGTVGVGWSRFEGTSDSFIATNRTVNPSGIIGGFHGGYNWQQGQFVFGVEGDYIFTGNMSGTSLEGPTTGLYGELNALASVRGRIGWAFDRTLLYATGGWGWGRYKAGANDSGIVTFRQTVSAPVVGAGVEWKLSPSFSVRAEGLHYFFNKTLPSAGSEVGTYTIRGVTTVRVGGSYHF